MFQGWCVELDQGAALREQSSLGMDAKTRQELRQRIADYRRLRTMTMDKPALERIDRIITETEERLRELEATRPRTDGAVLADG
jgi:hypothetical protein